MAIDNAEKRRNLAAMHVPIVPGITPNASKDVEWRQQSAYGYSGISPSSVVPPTFPYPYFRGLTTNVGKLLSG